MVYGSITLFFAGFLGRMLYFKYIQSLWIMPMYLFSGVFYSLEDAPEWLNAFAQIFPLTHVLEIVRPMVLGYDVEWSAVLLRMAILLVIFAISFYCAYKTFTKRLFD
ncbi:MAG: lipooligosaccharide transport system permease protein [bacterium]|jgi:lipooligosaccharide transport system permease protein